MIKIEKISNKNLEKIKGGASITVWGGVLIAAAIVFISGLIEGITNPPRCNN